MLNGDMARIHSFEVVPSLPEPLQPLLEIAYNLWWTWQPDAVALFMRLDHELWHQTYHNPVRMLGRLPQQTLKQAAEDKDFLNRLSNVHQQMREHLTQQTDWAKAASQKRDPYTVAYFCAEFGLTESLQIYSGGLGCLAGDHLKSASELGLPLVAVGLMYRHGYFQQYLNADGWQEEYYPDLDFSNLPLTSMRMENGEPVTVSVKLAGRTVHIAIWQVRVGQVPLYLLDTNLHENEEGDRHITDRLYGGDMEMRIKQEIVLGVGGTRALEAMGIDPDICHMNEGHSAFLALERIRKLIESHDLSFDQARQQAAAGHVFTTHTPVPAGIDRFPPEMMQRFFKHFHDALKLDMEGLLALGREDVTNRQEFFSMATLAMRTADHVNGVSKLHGEVSRDMWHTIWPKVPKHEVPIGHVTNGVHARSWLSPDLMQLFDHYLGSQWRDNPSDPEAWRAVEDIPDAELWRVHEHRRSRLVDWSRRQLRKQLEARGANAHQMDEACDALSERALTIGFARRFATYKRGSLFLRDTERLFKLLEDADRPIQFLIAGKSHPADGGGKDLIRQIVNFAAESDAGHRIVFLENYDIYVARYLVQGCDIWLNNPRRPMEASGTSGMKGAINGVLNCSVLDGWWDEAYEPGIGWAIGQGETYHDREKADRIESKALYDLLENHIVPAFYERDSQGVPGQWVQRMKKSIARLMPRFNTNRMVQQYAEQFYLPALDRSRRLAADELTGAADQARYKARLREAWPKVRIEDVSAQTRQPLSVDQTLPVEATVQLDGLTGEDVRPQVYYGPLDNDGQLTRGQATDMQHVEDLGDGRHRFQGSVDTATSGRHGFAVRAIPARELNLSEPGLIRWEGEPEPHPDPTPESEDEAEQLATEEADAG